MLMQHNLKKYHRVNDFYDSKFFGAFYINQEVHIDFDLVLSHIDPHDYALRWKIGYLQGCYQQKVHRVKEYYAQLLTNPCLMKRFSTVVLEQLVLIKRNKVIGKLNDLFWLGILDAKYQQEMVGNNKQFDILQRAVLQQWWDENRDDPYPSDEKKNHLAFDAHLHPDQITRWFHNRRKRGREALSKENEELEEFPTIPVADIQIATPQDYQSASVLVAPVLEMPTDGSESKPFHYTWDGIESSMLSIFGIMDPVKNENEKQVPMVSSPNDTDVGFIGSFIDLPAVDPEWDILFPM